MPSLIIDFFFLVFFLSIRYHQQNYTQGYYHSARFPLPLLSASSTHIRSSPPTIFSATRPMLNQSDPTTPYLHLIPTIHPPHRTSPTISLCSFTSYNQSLSLVALPFGASDCAALALSTQLLAHTPPSRPALPRWESTK